MEKIIPLDNSYREKEFKKLEAETLKEVSEILALLEVKTIKKKWRVNRMLLALVIFLGIAIILMCFPELFELLLKWIDKMLEKGGKIRW